MVTINSVSTPIGRWPNEGFLTIDSHVSNTSITDIELSSSPTWTGAEIVIRKNQYIWDRNKITTHSGNTISYTSGSDYDAIDGYGYFIQNDLKTLDKQVNGSMMEQISIFTSEVIIQNYNVKISSKDQLLTFWT